MTDEKRNEIINRIGKEIYRMFDDVAEANGNADRGFCREAAYSCVNAKREIIDLLSNHPKWDEDNLRVHFTSDYTRPVDNGAAGSSLNRLGIIIEQHADPENRWRFKSEYLSEPGLYVSVNPNPLLTLARILQEYPFYCYLADDLRVSKSTENVIKGILPDARIHEGTKSTRAVIGLLRQYGWEDALRGKNVTNKDIVNPQTGEVMRTVEVDELARAREQYNNYADQMNELKVTRHTVISVNPMDFLRMSYGNSWGSCHYIATNGHWYSSESGCYSAGCWSYAYDTETIIFYTVDEGVDESDLTYADKYTRQLYFWNGKALMPSRVYPANDNTDSPVYKENRAIMEQVIADCNGHGNMWKKLPYTSEECGIDSYGHHYPDYEYHRYPIFAQSFLVEDASDEDMTDFCRFRIGSNRPICVCCGNELDDNDYPVCSSCEDGRRFVCECCENEYRYEDDGVWVDDRWVCNSCINENYVWDDLDERYIRQDESVHVIGLGYTHERNCECNSRIDYCDHCGEYYFDEDMTEIDGEYWCSECVENHAATCSRCGELLPADDMLEKEDGEYVCRDCVEDDEYICDCCHTLHKGQPAETIGALKYCDTCYNTKRSICKHCGEAYYRIDRSLPPDVCFNCCQKHYVYDRTTGGRVYAEPSRMEDADTLLVVRIGEGYRVTELTGEQLRAELEAHSLRGYYEVLIPMDFALDGGVYRSIVPYKGKTYNGVAVGGLSRDNIRLWFNKFFELTAHKTEEEVA